MKRALWISCGSIRSRKRRRRVDSIGDIEPSHLLIGGERETVEVRAVSGLNPVRRDTRDGYAKALGLSGLFSDDIGEGFQVLNIFLQGSEAALRIPEAFAEFRR